MVFNSDSNDCNLSSLVLPGGEKIIRLSDTGLCGAFRAMRILALEFVSKNENRSRKRRGAKCPRKGHTVLWPSFVSVLYRLSQKIWKKRLRLLVTFFRATNKNYFGAPPGGAREKNSIIRISFIFFLSKFEKFWLIEFILLTFAVKLINFFCLFLTPYSVI